MRICHARVGLYFNDKFKGPCFLFSRKLLLYDILVSIWHLKRARNFTENSKRNQILSPKIVSSKIIPLRSL